MRGKPRCCSRTRTLYRITPAGAGKTAPPQRTRRNAWDHPRRCGENPLLQPQPLLQLGSPPQVRGKHCPPARNKGCFGITPAGAGKTAPPQRTRRNAWDHPRRCGENEDLILAQRRVGGSPPQVRGKLPRDAVVGAAHWITPAGAGKTHDYAEARYWRRDHPRRCGENYVSTLLGCRLSGSPPQVRGKHGDAAVEQAANRITPAGAGKTQRLHVFWAWRQDHPRRCGENSPFSKFRSR